MDVSMCVEVPVCGGVSMCWSIGIRKCQCMLKVSVLEMTMSIGGYIVLQCSLWRCQYVDVSVCGDVTMWRC